MGGGLEPTIHGIQPPHGPSFVHALPSPPVPLASSLSCGQSAQGTQSHWETNALRRCPAIRSPGGRGTMHTSPLKTPGWPPIPPQRLHNTGRSATLTPRWALSPYPGEQRSAASQCTALYGRVSACTVSTDPRPPSPCVRVNDVSGPFLGEGGLRPPSQILALRVYNMPAVSTISRPRLLVVHSVYRPQTAILLCMYA